jgi:uncharacterized protein YbjT (DUF2867 family)
MSPTAVAQRRLKVTDTNRDVLVTGGTGYIGTALVDALVARGHRVRVLTRQASAQRVPEGAEVVIGDVLSADSVKAALRFGDTVVHLVGTPSPGPGKGAEFQRVDLGSIRATVAAAKGAGVLHLVYVSVAQPAPVMQDYVAARVAGEQAIAEAGLRATVLRPWYVLGPGHRWPILLTPLYALAGLIPGLREGARRTGLVTLQQMVTALVRAVEHPTPKGITVVDVPMIKQASLDTRRDEPIKHSSS